MPAGAIADQHGNGAFCHLRADFRQMQVQHFRIGGGIDHRGAYTMLRADGTEDVGAIVPIIAHYQRPRTDRCPDIRVGPLLADAGLILEPNFYRRARRRIVERSARQTLEVF